MGNGVGMSEQDREDLERSVVRPALRGHVHLVGAGPGDPELLTRRAYRLLSEAEVLAYDELVSPAILAIAPETAERINVGRRLGTCPDAPSIHPRVLERALEGKNVVRLKGGDPMIFGRGGEEAAELAALRIPFEVVPGVSAALGAAASNGIALTHRDAAASVTFVTAHRKTGVPENVGRRFPADGTVVLYMGLSTLEETARALIAEGRAATTPVAVVSHATLPTERTLIGTLATIAGIVRGQAVPTPALVIVGDVVGLRVTPTARLEAPAASPPARTARR